MTDTWDEPLSSNAKLLRDYLYGVRPYTAHDGRVHIQATLLHLCGVNIVVILYYVRNPLLCSGLIFANQNQNKGAIIQKKIFSEPSKKKWIKSSSYILPTVFFCFMLIKNLKQTLLFAVTGKYQVVSDTKNIVHLLRIITE